MGVKRGKRELCVLCVVRRECELWFAEMKLCGQI